MNKEKVIAIFDIGKTNKKILLFNQHLKVIFQKEQKFKPTVDEDGDECDDIELIEKWVLSTLEELVEDSRYEIKAVNFTTYGASLAFIDETGKRLTPIYNYLKKIPENIQQNLFDQYGGQEEFCRKTASPALGLLLNSGIQILWLKQTKPEIFAKAKSIIHFPQYLSYTLTGRAVSESTSIGCHTFLWDFDNKKYHQWLADKKIDLPEPQPNSTTYKVKIKSTEVNVGIGIHDSSSSLAPYIRGSKERFLLVSTGTWCINMNPNNHSPLTKQQLNSDCLSFLSIEQTPVKSSRLFMGHIHDVNTKRLTNYFKIPENSFKKVKTNEKIIQAYIEDPSRSRVFFKSGTPDDYIDTVVDLSKFSTFEEAYHRLMFDLTQLNCESIELITDKNDGVKNIYISGGFARNEIFIRLLAEFYPDKKIYTSEIDNASALGAALTVWDAVSAGTIPEINLGLKQWK